MYKHDGQDIFVIDGHTHFWDARPANWRNQYGESWIECFFAYHSRSTVSVTLPPHCGPPARCDVLAL
jgi:hypothetical protein